MDASAPQFLIALEGSGIGQAIRQSTWIYPAANVGHVVSVILFFSSLSIMDLTLLGAIDARSRKVLVKKARATVVPLLSIVVLTGMLLFTAEASHLALNRVFQIKAALIVFAGLNVAFFGGRAVEYAYAMRDGEPLPAIARVSAAISLALWLTVAALGRYIAYA